MKKAWTEEEFSGFQGEFYEYAALPSGASIMPKPVQKPHPPILLPLDSQQSFVPMGRMGYRIAIGGGSSHNERGDAVLKGRRQELPPGVDRRGPPWRFEGGDPHIHLRGRDASAGQTHLGSRRQGAHGTSSGPRTHHAPGRFRARCQPVWNTGGGGGADSRVARRLRRRRNHVHDARTPALARRRTAEYSTHGRQGTPQGQVRPTGFGCDVRDHHEDMAASSFAVCARAWAHCAAKHGAVRPSGRVTGSATDRTSREGSRACRRCGGAACGRII